MSRQKEDLCIMIFIIWHQVSCSGCVSGVASDASSVGWAVVFLKTPSLAPCRYWDKGCHKDTSHISTKVSSITVILLLQILLLLLTMTIIARLRETEWENCFIIKKKDSKETTTNKWCVGNKVMYFCEPYAEHLPEFVKPFSISEAVLSI